MEEWSEDQDCERCDRRFEFEEYVIAVGGSLRPDGSGTMDIELCGEPVGLDFYG